MSEKKLFELLKSHQYDKLIDIIKSDPNIDLNEVDETGTYLIQYAILFRQRVLVALLISKNCKLDIIDSDGRSIFYIPIKFGYDDIVSLLINFSNVVVGIPLLELQDKYMNIPLHYAIIYSKHDIIQEILNTKTNLNFKDIDGNTSLHLIIKYKIPKSLSLIQSMINNKIGQNLINKLGQNALHIAIETNNIEVCELLIANKINIDAQTLDNHLTPLIIATIGSNIKIIKLLINSNVDINKQDIYGNTCLNYAIINKSQQIIELFVDDINKMNVNLIDINGNITVNLFFINNYDYNDLSRYNFSKILSRSKLNIQNNTGKTTWHYLAESNIWDSYSDILSQSKNKIFIQDNNSNTPFSIVNTNFKSQFDKFIDLISNSFYNRISKDIKYKYNLNIQCLKDSIQYTKSNTIDPNKDLCIQTIKDLIINQHISFPEVKKSYCVVDLEVSNIKFSSYIGITLDIIMGLIYISNKFDLVQTTLSSNFIHNSKLEEYYFNNGINRGNFDEFLNFELIWSYQKIFYPTIIKELIQKFLKDSTKRFLIIPVGIELSNGSHANILFYDKLSNQMERFEPYGNDFPPGFYYNPNSLDHHIKSLFSNYFVNSNDSNDSKNFKYFGPSDYQTKIGLQLLDTMEYSKEKNIGDPGGFCAAWSLFYAEMRIVNIGIDRKDLIPKLINHIRLKHMTFRTVIRGFTKNITDIRDSYLSDAKIDINKWINENYTESEWTKVVELITSKL
jgi:ankyrin repeat protein